MYAQWYSPICIYYIYTAISISSIICSLTFVCKRSNSRNFLLLGCGNYDIQQLETQLSFPKIETQETVCTGNYTFIQFLNSLAIKRYLLSHCFAKDRLYFMYFLYAWLMLQCSITVCWCNQLLYIFTVYLWREIFTACLFSSVLGLSTLKWERHNICTVQKKEFWSKSAKFPDLYRDNDKFLYFTTINSYNYYNRKRLF